MNPDPKQKKHRSKKYLKFIRSKPCLICGHASVACHVGDKTSKGMATKTHDSRAIPMCHEHHDLFDNHRWEFDDAYPYIDVEREIGKLNTEYMILMGV